MIPTPNPRPSESGDIEVEPERRADGWHRRYLARDGQLHIERNPA